MLADVSIRDFAKKVAAAEPVVPAGGCVIALSGLMGASLLEMSVNSALNQAAGEKHAAFFNEAKTLLTKAQTELLACIDGDAVAYQGVLDAYKLPKCTPAEIIERKARVQAAAAAAIEVPLKISEACLAVLEPGISMLTIIKHGVLGDLNIGLLVLKTGIEGSLAAARINLSLIQDDTAAQQFQTRIDAIQAKFLAAISEL